MSIGVLEVGFVGITIVALKTISTLDFASSDFKDEKNRYKFNKNVAAAIYYSFTTLWATWIAISKNFDVKEMTKSYDIYDQREAAYIYFYAVQIGFYIFEIYNTLFPSNKVPDRGRLIFHHFLTLSLILGSLYSGYWRVGFLVLLLHDISDVLLGVAKATQYHFRETGRLESLVTLLFGIFVIGFVITRIILFPLLVIRPSALSDAVVCKIDSWRPVDGIMPLLPSWGVIPVLLMLIIVVPFWKLPLSFAGVKDTSCITLTLACGWGLCALFFLQLTWLANIVSQLFKVKDKGIGAEDVRSDDEEDGDGEEEKEKENKIK